MRCLLMLRKLQVVEDSTRRRDTRAHTLDTEALERLHAKLLSELIAVYSLREHPLIEAVGVMLGAKRIVETLLHAALKDDLAGLKVRYKLINICILTLSDVELTRR